MRFGLDDQILEKIIRCFQEEPTVKRVLLFGSRARGTERYNSDIDLAFYSDGHVSADFILKLDDAAGIYMVDIIDMGTLKNEDLRKSIENEGILLWAASCAKVKGV